MECKQFLNLKLQPKVFRLMIDDALCIQNELHVLSADALIIPIKCVKEHSSSSVLVEITTDLTDQLTVG